MLVQEVMTTPVVTVAASASIGQAATIMLDHHISGLPVVEHGGKVVGIITEGDFLRRSEIATEGRAPSLWKELFMRSGKAAEDYVRAHARTVGDVMTRNLLTIPQTASLSEAVDLMERKHVKRLPVVDGDALIGILARSDLVRIIARIYSSVPSQKITDDETIRRAVMAELALQNWSGKGMIHVKVRDGVVDLTGVVYNDESRAAARVAAETVEGVKAVNERLDWVEPTSGMMVMP